MCFSACWNILRNDVWLAIVDVLIKQVMEIEKNQINGKRKRDILLPYLDENLMLLEIYQTILIFHA